jgi:Arc/MetJ-type ribon-helix-helix transcriptional regulator
VKILEIDVPEQLAREIDRLVQEGWFLNEGELARLALADFVHHHRFRVQEQFQREDILWALSLKKPGDKSPG